MSFTAQDVAKLRAQTGVGMMECKKALTDAILHPYGRKNWCLG